jgi:cellulose synthase/poly-beta-1,6-N-acetylglucosamine synthase-like glycosyltransferase
LINLCAIVCSVVYRGVLYRMPMWAASLEIANYWSKFTDPSRNPFRGLYQFNGFDLAIMIPYFAVLIVLASFGVHRYYLVYSYLRNRKNIPGPPPPITRWPRVTVQLPIYNERYVIERLVDAVARFDYPRELLDIQVLDDSTDETQQIALVCVERFQALGVPIRFLHRNNREGYKAGALAEGLASATGEFIVIFDADFLPGPDFLHLTLPYFVDPKIAMVQTRWTYINRDYSALTEVESILLDGHFVIEHGSRSRSAHFFNFNGTAGVWRRTAIDDAGGWQHDTLTEDTDLSYRAQLRGWQFLYLPDVECASELPVEMNAFKAQQARWAKGLMQTSKKILPRVVRAEVPLGVKIEAIFHLTASISYPLMLVLSTLLLPAMIVRFYQGWFQMLLIDLPLFLASSCSISGFYLAAERALYPQRWTRTILYLPFVMAVGIGLSVRNAKGVLEALFNVPSEFVRTPKYRIEGHVRGQSATPIAGQVSSTSRDGDNAWAKKNYRNRAGWIPYIEVGLGLYFAITIVYAIQNENYATVPFLLLFVWGYLYTGAMSLGQAYFEQLRLRVRIPDDARSAATGVPGF